MSDAMDPAKPVDVLSAVEDPSQDTLPELPPSGGAHMEGVAPDEHGTATVAFSLPASPDERGSEDRFSTSSRSHDSVEPEDEAVLIVAVDVSVSEAPNSTVGAYKFNFMLTATWRREPEDPEFTLVNPPCLRSEEDFRVVRRALVEEFAGVVVPPSPEITPIMRDFAPLAQFTAVLERSATNFVVACMEHELLRESKAFRAFVLCPPSVWQSQWVEPRQKHPLASLFTPDARTGHNIVSGLFASEVKDEIGSDFDRRMAENLYNRLKMTDTALAQVEEQIQSIVRLSVLTTAEEPSSGTPFAQIAACLPRDTLKHRELALNESLGNLHVAQRKQFKAFRELPPAESKDPDFPAMLEEAAATAVENEATEEPASETPDEYLKDGLVASCTEDHERHLSSLLSLHHESHTCKEWLNAAREALDARKVAIGAHFAAADKLRKAVESCRKKKTLEDTAAESHKQALETDDFVHSISFYYYGIQAANEYDDKDVKVAEEQLVQATEHFEIVNEMAIREVDAVSKAVREAVRILLARWLKANEDAARRKADELQEVLTQSGLAHCEHLEEDAPSSLLAIISEPLLETIML